MGLLLVFDPAPVDFFLSRLFYAPGAGFAGRNSFWLEDILHDHARRGAILFAVALLAGFIASVFSRRLAAFRRRLGYIVLSLTLSIGIVAPLKALTAVHCPWSLAEFGGKERFTPLPAKRAPTGKPGRCWPGGHASTGFSLIALFFALRDARPRAARIALAVALGLGTIFSVGRMAQGAHFLSHNLWTLLLDGSICMICYRWILYRPQEEMKRTHRSRLRKFDSRKERQPGRTVIPARGEGTAEKEFRPAYSSRRGRP
jgi:membrane-associated PAP2 superfamily phosphatase